MRIVAMEEHIVSRDLMRRIPPAAMAARGWPRPDQLPSAMAKGEELVDAGPARLAAMDKAGITLQVLSGGGPGADLMAPEEGRAFARDFNDYVARVVLEHPDRFAFFAHLPMSAPEAAADELERAVKELGARGAMINGTTAGAFLDDARFERILARAELLGVPLYVHPALPPEPVRSAYYHGLPDHAGLLLSGPGFGWHAEAAVHILRLVLAGALDRHPTLKLIIGHMGEGLPMMLGRVDEVFGEFADKQLARPVSQAILEQVWVTTSGFFTLPPFMAALLAFGADRVLFAVDYPFGSNRVGSDFLRSLPVSAAEKLKIGHANADALLGLSRP